MPNQVLPFDRAVCLAKEACLARGPGRDSDDTLFAASLYGAIADISIKVVVVGGGAELLLVLEFVRIKPGEIERVRIGNCVWYV